MSEIRWDVLTIGHLSRNRYWGESDEHAYRVPLCTSTLIRTPQHCIVVDPSRPPEQMAELLDHRAGIVLAAVDTVFLTHFHGDHRVGLEAFSGARWCMASAEVEFCTRQLPVDAPDRHVLDRLQAVSETLVPGIAIVATPGHTLGHASLLFESEGVRVIVAGDAAMTRDFFWARDYYFNTVDADAAVHSIEQLARIADIVVPGHDNYFLSKRLR